MVLVKEKKNTQTNDPCSNNTETKKERRRKKYFSGISRCSTMLEFHNPFIAFVRRDIEVDRTKKKKGKVTGMISVQAMT